MITLSERQKGGKEKRWSSGRVAGEKGRTFNVCLEQMFTREKKSSLSTGWTWRKRVRGYPISSAQRGGKNKKGRRRGKCT